jgi:hypothetical protein
LLISFKTSLLWRKSAALLGFGFKTEKSEINLSCQISELRCIRKLAANKRQSFERKLSKLFLTNIIISQLTLYRVAYILK